ncbi:hypothetical protein GX411_01305 [Candidatus Fermentibacteria bacterium]|nr:hypothetical protein [Candidatus Fermentibacteria bacterium]
MIRRKLAVLAVLVPACCARGGAPGGSERTIELVAGKRITVTVTLDPEASFIRESAGRYRIVTPEAAYSVSALLDCWWAAGSPTGPGGEELDETAPIVDEEGHTVVPLAFVRGDSSYIERRWRLGSCEDLVLRFSMTTDTPEALLAICSGTLRSGRFELWEGSRRVQLASRSREAILLDAGSGDVDPDPLIEHRMNLSIRPDEMRLAVTDTFTVDASNVGRTEGTGFLVPVLDGSAPETIVPLTGRMERSGDSVICFPDSATMLFRGFYSTDVTGFYIEHGETASAQVRLLSSFCGGEWFYPGSTVPAAYRIRASVPAGTEFYAPFVLESRHASGSSEVYSYSSQSERIAGPVCWAAGRFEKAAIAGGASTLMVSDEVPDSLAAELTVLSDMLCTSVWKCLGFPEGRLDVVVVSSIGRPVLAAGPGALLVSPDMLASLSGHASWADSLAAGTRPSSPAVAAKACRAMLELSTYLPDEIEMALCAYGTCRFARDWQSAGSADSLLEACLLYYLHSTAETGGMEPAIADPQLTSSPLAQQVLLGKAPCVFQMLSEVIPDFDAGMGRFLSALRHEGYAYARLASSLGLAGSGRTSEFFDAWLYQPGVPQIVVSWRESGNGLFARIEQLQPGPEFPLPLGRVAVFYEGGRRILETLGRPESGGWQAVTRSLNQPVERIDLFPGRIIPADIVYERV